MMHTVTSAPVLSMSSLCTAWPPRGLLLGSMNALPLMWTSSHLCQPLSPSTSSSVLLFGLHVTLCYMLTMPRLPCLDRGSCSLTSMRLRSFPPLGLWMTLASLWLPCHPPSLVPLRRALAPNPRSLFLTHPLSLPPGGEPLMMTFALRKLSFNHLSPLFQKRSSSSLASLVSVRRTVTKLAGGLLFFLPFPLPCGGHFIILHLSSFILGGFSFFFTNFLYFWGSFSFIFIFFTFLGNFFFFLFYIFALFVARAGFLFYPSF